MTRIITAVALVISVVCLAQNPDLPEELAGLVPLLDDQARLFEAVRAFDKKETALARDEFTRAKGLAGQDGEEEQAEALRFQVEKRLRLVRLAYEELLERHPGSAQGHNFYGELLYDHFSDEAAALREWKLAEALDRKYSAPLNNLGIHYCHNAEPLRGLDYFERVLELDPDQPDYLFNVVQVYLTLFPEVQARYGWDSPRLYAEAMKLSKRAVEKDPDDYDLWKDYAQNHFLAEQFNAKADWGRAAKAWQQVRKRAEGRDPVFYTWLNEARAWLRKPAPKRAERCLVEALTIHPDSVVANNLLEKIRAEREK